MPVQVSPSPLTRYLLVGTASILIDVGLLFLLHQVIGVELTVAVVAAFSASLVFNFILNRRGMAAGGMAGMSRHFLRFATLVAFNLAVTVIVVSVAAAAGVPYLLAKLAVVAASTGWNFVLYRGWVFTPVRPRPADVDLLAAPRDVSHP